MAAAPKRRWFQFSLKTMLLALTLVSAESLGAAGAELWPRVAPPLPKRAGAVVRVRTVNQFTAAVAAVKDGQTIVLRPEPTLSPSSSGSSLQNSLTLWLTHPQELTSRSLSDPEILFRNSAYFTNLAPTVRT